MKFDDLMRGAGRATPWSWRDRGSMGSMIAGPYQYHPAALHRQVYMSIWACRAGPARARLGTARFHRAQARHGETSCRAVPGQHAVPTFLPRHATVKLRRAVPCLGHGQPGSAVPCPCPGHKELNQLQIMQYKQISYVQTQAFNNS